MQEYNESKVGIQDYSQSCFCAVLKTEKQSEEGNVS